jgi:hypothetical protein
MSPHRRLSINSQRHPSQIQDIFLGLAFQLHPARDPARPNDRDLEYTAVLNDATGVIESETFHLDFHVHDDAEPELQADEVRRLLGPLMELTRTIQVDKGMNVGQFTRSAGQPTGRTPVPPAAAAGIFWAIRC